MNIQNFVTTQQNYLQAALVALIAEMDFRPLETRKERVRLRMEDQIKDWFALVDILQEADDATYERARKEPEWNFVAADAESEQRLLAALSLGQQYLALCHRLAFYGITVYGKQQLVTRVEKLHRLLHFSDDYANTPAYRKIAGEAQKEYEEGRCEEGGWTL